MERQQGPAMSKSEDPLIGIVYVVIVVCGLIAWYVAR